MSQHYINVTEEQINSLRDALSLLDHLNPDKSATLDLYLYAMVNSVGVVDAAKEAVAETAEQEMDETQVQISQVAVAVPVSSDTLYYLAGSGLKLHREDFVYVSGNDGPRQGSFAFSHYKPTLSLREMQNLVLADSDAWLDQFVRQSGTKAPATTKIPRDAAAAAAESLLG
jgi:hypothetical protein